MKRMANVCLLVLVCTAAGVRAGGQSTNPADDIALPAAGTIGWQVPLDSSYSLVRPAVAPDGTIYVVDAGRTLYAISPVGTLRWQVASAGSAGLAVGPDGTVYVGSEDFVRAYDPAGALLWSFQQSPRAFIFLGLGVGPDANIYCATSDGMGVFSLTPQGTLRWTNPEAYNRPNVAYSELVFGPNGAAQQLYFYANHHIRAVALDGTSVFTLERGDRPTVSPLDGTLHVGDAAYRPDGTLYWAFGLSLGDKPVLGPDGNHYIAAFGSLYALRPSGSAKWVRSNSDYLAASAVDPANTHVLFVGNAAVGFDGVISAHGVGTGKQLWRLALPQFNGSVQAPERWPGFSADGRVAYYVTTASGVLPQRAWLTAVGVK